MGIIAAAYNTDLTMAVGERHEGKGILVVPRLRQNSLLAHLTKRAEVKLAVIVAVHSTTKGVKLRELGTRVAANK